jgi:hypothetical protein
MMRSDFVALDGTKKTFDLDEVVEVVRAFSGTHEGWTSLVVYEPTHDAFIELRSSPPDIRGISKDEAEEVLPKYLAAYYGLDENKVANVRDNPKEWKLVDLR